MDNVMLNKLLDFIQEHNKYTNRELLSEYINTHERYGTFDYAIDEFGNIIGFVRWNMSFDGKVGEILDMCVREDMRNKNIGRDFILRALVKFPLAITLRFRRGVRGDNRIREIKVNKILERSIF